MAALYHQRVVNWCRLVPLSPQSNRESLGIGEPSDDWAGESRHGRHKANGAGIATGPTLTDAWSQGELGARRFNSRALRPANLCRPALAPASGSSGGSVRRRRAFSSPVPCLGRSETVLPLWPVTFRSAIAPRGFGVPSMSHREVRSCLRALRRSGRSSSATLERSAGRWFALCCAAFAGISSVLEIPLVFGALRLDP